MGAGSTSQHALCTRLVRRGPVAELAEAYLAMRLDNVARCAMRSLGGCGEAAQACPPSQLAVRDDGGPGGERTLLWATYKSPSQSLLPPLHLPSSPPSAPSELPARSRPRTLQLAETHLLARHTSAHAPHPNLCCGPVCHTFYPAHPTPNNNRGIYHTSSPSTTALYTHTALCHSSPQRAPHPVPALLRRNTSRMSSPIYPRDVSPFDASYLVQYRFPTSNVRESTEPYPPRRPAVPVPAPAPAPAPAPPAPEFRETETGLWTDGVHKAYSTAYAAVQTFLGSVRAKVAAMVPLPLARQDPGPSTPPRMDHHLNVREPVVGRYDVAEVLPMADNKLCDIVFALAALAVYRDPKDTAHFAIWSAEYFVQASIAELIEKLCHEGHIKHTYGPKFYVSLSALGRWQRPYLPSRPPSTLPLPDEPLPRPRKRKAPAIAAPAPTQPRATTSKAKRKGKGKERAVDVGPASQQPAAVDPSPRPTKRARKMAPPPPADGEAQQPLRRSLRPKKDSAKAEEAKKAASRTPAPGAPRVSKSKTPGPSRVARSKTPLLVLAPAAPEAAPVLPPIAELDEPVEVAAVVLALATVAAVAAPIAPIAAPPPCTTLEAKIEHIESSLGEASSAPIAPATAILPPPSDYPAALSATAGPSDVVATHTTSSTQDVVVDIEATLSQDVPAPSAPALAARPRTRKQRPPPREGTRKSARNIPAPLLTSATLELADAEAAATATDTSMPSAESSTAVSASPSADTVAPSEGATRETSAEGAKAEVPPPSRKRKAEDAPALESVQDEKAQRPVKKARTTAAARAKKAATPVLLADPAMSLEVAPREEVKKSRAPSQKRKAQEALPDEQEPAQGDERPAKKAKVEEKTPGANEKPARAPAKSRSRAKKA
ncbi:hypothetical protein OBBRIDRAFT_890429 [Obba rivulosa]|uniref:Uncharacterized protein n=1 Tax=Obba rivulosa TaxID=1052685 RepID=A0A8E2AKZ6_9APHY|nr:hypothetical protein OBBRIDRAFT_890429 [Obba rivulosa]